MDSPSAAAADSAAGGRQRPAMARRAVPSLAVALLANLCLSGAVIFLFGSGRRYRALSRPIWFPPLVAVHLATLGSSLLMGLAGWLVWADGGFRAQKGGYTNAFHLYVSQVSSSAAWYPVVLRVGSARIGWVFCLVNFGFLTACYESFKSVNHAAGLLVRPCLAWAFYLSFVTCYMISMI